MSKAEAAEQAARAQQIVAMTGFFFTGQEPGVIGLALAELMAIFLFSHQMRNDAAKEADLRTKLLTEWCETVWSLVAVHEGRGGPMQ